MILGRRPILGIYQREGNRLTICVKYGGNERPKAFLSDDLHALLVLHRVQPVKK